MKFLCLGYLDEASFNKLPDPKRSEILEQCSAQCVPFRATGKILEEEALRASKTARTIRTRNGRTTITDGPFTETKEQIGSYFVVDAESIDEAIAIACLHPAALMGGEYGFGLEVRQIQ